MKPIGFTDYRKAKALRSGSVTVYASGTVTLPHRRLQGRVETDPEMDPQVQPEAAGWRWRRRRANPELAGTRYTRLSRSGGR